MKQHSIAKRLVSIVLLIEVLSALSMTGFVFLYERHTHFHSLDVALRGHADTLMGAVVDANDVDDRVVLDMQDIHIPKGDLYEVWDNGRDLLGRTSGWSAPSDLQRSTDVNRNLVVDGTAYRLVRVEGSRFVDPEASSISHKVVVIYGSPTRQAWGPVLRAVESFVVASSVLVLVSAIIVIWLVRSSISPLEELAAAAGSISGSCWRFQPPEAARRTKELAPLVLALDAMVSRLQLAFEQQRRFVSDSGHELKTAVTVVKSSLQLLEMRDRSPREYRAGLFASLNDCLRMEELVQRMLTLARVEEGGWIQESRSQASAVHLADMPAGVLDAMESLQSLACLRGISLVYQDSLQVQAALRQDDWQTICTNLLLNSLQHSPAGSQVCVTLEARGEYAVCQIEDQGAGIAPEALPYVFDRFYRADASRARSSGGTGLGLAICKALVEQAHGGLSIRSVEGSGTVVTVEIPMAAQPVSVEQRSALVAS